MSGGMDGSYERLIGDLSLHTFAGTELGEEGDYIPITILLPPE